MPEKGLLGRAARNWGPKTGGGEGGRAVGQLRPEAPARDVVPIKEDTLQTVRVVYLEAAALRHGLMPAEADGHGHWRESTGCTLPS
jgi:hypothetical protein